MASISQDIPIHAPADVVWDAVRDTGAVHERLLPGFVSATTVVPDGRLVRVGNGMLIRERILDVDDDGRRLVHALHSGWSCYYVSVMRVRAHGAAHSRLLWRVDYRAEVHDLIPRAIARASEVIQRTLDPQPIVVLTSRAVSVKNASAEVIARRAAWG